MVIASGTRLAQAVGVSRQVANGYLQALAREGLVDAEGTTRARVYALRTLSEVERRYPRKGLQEDLVWRELIAPVVARLHENVRNIWHYASTEMINNAMDHSGAREVQVGVRQDALSTEALVADEGEGIFVKIQRALGLQDPREAILELAKGKLTTAPENHTGEGIFLHLARPGFLRDRVAPLALQPRVARRRYDRPSGAGHAGHTRTDAAGQRQSADHARGVRRVY